MADSTAYRGGGGVGGLSTGPTHAGPAGRMLPSATGQFNESRTPGHGGIGVGRWLIPANPRLAWLRAFPYNCRPSRAGQYAGVPEPARTGQTITCKSGISGRVAAPPGLWSSAMYAVIESGGKQHRVTEGEVLKLEKIEA